MADNIKNYEVQQYSQNNTSIGAAYSTTEENGYSIMPPENNFSIDPLETGGEIEYGREPKNLSDKEKGKTWTTPREKQKIKTKTQAKSKLLEVRNHILFLEKMAKELPDAIKKPESLGDLWSLSKECLEIYNILSENPSGIDTLNPDNAELLNALTDEIEYSYGDVFSVLTAQARMASTNVGSIPNIEDMDGAIKELIRQKYGDKNQEELDKLMDTLSGTAEYQGLIDLLKSTTKRIIGEVGNLLWAEGLDRLEKDLKDALQGFKSKFDFVISFFTNLISVFGHDPESPTDGMRKTFDLVDTIINNPFTKILVPLWTAYKPAINICLSGIDKIKKQRDENFNNIGLTQHLVDHVKSGNKSKISKGMVLGLPGYNETGKQELLFFMMDLYMHSYKEIEQISIPISVNDYFMNNIDLINAGNNKDRIKVDYNNPLNPWDNEFSHLLSDAYMSKGDIWVMLYGNMLKPPSK